MVGGGPLAAQFAAFNCAALAGVAVRVASFAALENRQIYYLLNLTVGVVMAAALDYVLYDRWIFRREVPVVSRSASS